MFERIMGLDVVDDELYRKYREYMTPILNSYGADFGYDFMVSDVLKSKTEGKINRVFTIDFPSRKVMENFFKDSNYLEIKRKFLDCSIGSKTVISIHEK